MKNELPDLSARLMPLAGRLETGDLPLFVAILERMAAERYRGWAADAPDEAERDALLRCVRLEEENAEAVEAAAPDAERRVAAIHEAVPELRQIFSEAYDPLAREDQMRLQAIAERLGRDLYRGFASDAEGEAAAALTACAEREEQNAQALERLLARTATDAA